MSVVREPFKVAETDKKKHYAGVHRTCRSTDPSSTPGLSSASSTQLARISPSTKDSKELDRTVSHTRTRSGLSGRRQNNALPSRTHTICSDSHTHTAPPPKPTPHTHNTQRHVIFRNLRTHVAGTGQHIHPPPA
jgi:hypothetical protein